MEKTKLEHLLNGVRLLIEHQKKVEKLKGEKFNIFSILKMERLENNTHSAFIGELLNPKGSHLKGSLFTQLFLDTIGNKSIDADKSKLELEFHIGKRDDIKKEGGRIDIFLRDNNGNSISIENKIDAGDQNTQIERYVNYNKGKNKVYYLTLWGSSPNIESKGNLEEGIDYYLISYQNHILKWLELCLKESVENPILRETIKQYILLIKKITNTMYEKENKDLTDIILGNYEEALYISSNLTNATLKIKEEIRDEVYKQLNEKLGDKYLIEKGGGVNSLYSQLWIRPVSIKDSHLFFGVESFSGRGNFDGHLFIGVINTNAPNPTDYAEINGNIAESKWWINIKKFEDYAGCRLSLSTPKIISGWHLDIKFREGLVNHIVVQIKAYLETETLPLIEYINQKNR